MRRRVVPILCLTLGLVIAAAGCSRSDAGDAATAAKVKAKLALDDMVDASTIDVDTRNRVVTLKGTVESDEARARAVMLARQTEGVRDIVDELTVESARRDTLPAAGREGPPSAADTSPGGIRHTVERGETLGSIALQEYGDKSRWREIYEANRNVLSHPDHLPVGAELTLPER